MSDQFNSQHWAILDDAHTYGRTEPVMPGEARLFTDLQERGYLTDRGVITEEGAAALVEFGKQGSGQQ